MALGTYQDVYTTYMFTKRVTDIDNSLKELLNSGYFDSLKSQAIHEIRKVKQKEEAIYKLLKLKDCSIDGLNNRLEEYRQSAINLSGAHLNEEIIYILKNNSEKKYAFYKEKVNKIINEEIIGRIGEKWDDGKEKTFADLCVEYLNSHLHGRGFYSKRGMDNAAKELLFSRITAEQRAGWKEIIDDRFSINEEDQEDEIKYSFNWLEVTHNWTPTEAKKHDKEVDEINDIIIEKIKELVPNDPQLIEDIIREMILPEKGRYAFFKGENINDIVGICGEIQGVYYLTKLLGAPNDNSFAQIKNLVQWKGGIIDEGSKKQPHQDIMLKEFGIQIKNSLKEDFHEINFAKASIDFMIDKAGLSKEVKDLLLNYYGTLHFNVPYKYNRKKDEYYHSEEPMKSRYKKEYLKSLKELQQANNDINILLSLCASAFMYIDVSENTDLDANVLYLLGGSAFVAASDILMEILAEIESKKHSFKITSNWKDFANTKTIVEALNDNQKYDQTYSEIVLSNIVLTSSFNFGSLDELYYR
jgi:hypothetical protein